jgi:hypothetical protein
VIALLPSPKDVRDLVGGLLGREVAVAPGRPVVPTDEVRAAVGVYVEDNLQLAAVLAVDLPLAAALGAALGLVPVPVAHEAVETGVLPPTIWENVSEVLNVAAALLNSNTGVHVRLYRSYSPDVLPANDVAALLRGFGHRLDLRLDVTGSGAGSLSIVRRPA